MERELEARPERADELAAEVAAHQGPELLGGAGRTLFALVVGTACGLLILLLLLDTGLSGLRLAALLEALRGDAPVEALHSLAEVLTAVLGLSLTVVAIVVQLASQRYSARIVDLFMQDPINGGAFGFMALRLETVATTVGSNETIRVSGVRQASRPIGIFRHSSGKPRMWTPIQ